MLTFSMGNIKINTEQNTLAERIFEQIFDLILTGALPLGAIINEANFAERFSVSRGPVREAVQRLQGLRLVTRERHMRARVVRFTESDLIDIFELREVAEGMACRLATVRMSDAEILQLVEVVKRSPQKNAVPHNEMDIHMRIAHGCGNKRIESLLCEDLYHILRVYRYRSGSEPGRWDRACEEHWQIVRAMQNRDPELAESLMRSHISGAIQTVLTSMDKIGIPVTENIVKRREAADEPEPNAAGKANQ